MITRRHVSLFPAVLSCGLLASSVAFAQSPSEPATTAETLPTPPPPPPPTPPAPAPRAKEATPHHAPRVPTQIETTQAGAVLERRVSTKEDGGAFLIIPWRSTEKVWEPMCIAPCRLDLDPYSTYRIAAQNGIASSNEFTLPQRSEALKLNVDTGNRRAHAFGQVLIAGGTVAVIVGGLLLATASKFSHEDDARIAGAITGGVGVLALAVGIPLTITTRTKVTTDTGHEISFLPKRIRLGGGFFLTQKGIAF